MSDPTTRAAIARGKPISAKRAAALLAHIAELESQLGAAHELIARLEAALRHAGHAESCALQYGGACSCRMQLVRRSKDGL